MKSLLKAIINKFEENTSLVAAVSGLWFNQAPQDVVYPYIVFSFVSGKQDFDSSSIFENILLQFSIFSDTTSCEEVCDINELLKGYPDDPSTLGSSNGFDFCELVVDDYVHLVMKRESFILRQIEQVWQYNVTYRVILYSDRE